jgi:nicotinate-nucleotide--dimethylbenzimidazole phosphoribosyltransferase
MNVNMEVRMRLAEAIGMVRPPDQTAVEAAERLQTRLTKPPGSLGELETLAARLAGLARVCPPPVPARPLVAVFAGDHGVHAQNVTPWPQEVTALMVANFAAGGAVVNAFARQVGAEVVVVDVGVATPVPGPGAISEVDGSAAIGDGGWRSHRVRAGSRDLSVGPALTRDEAHAAIEVGLDVAGRARAAGFDILLTGDMGIANTTPAAALVAAFTSATAAEVTGRGTGVDDETLARKTAVVARALDLHRPTLDPVGDPLGVLAALGGLEHAALAGFILGGAALGVPVILDGVIACSAALAAAAFAPAAVGAMIAGHRSVEPGASVALRHLGLNPLIDLGLRLGEGTGAVLAFPIVASAVRVLHEVATLESMGVAQT